MSTLGRAPSALAVATLAIVTSCGVQLRGAQCSTSGLYSCLKVSTGTGSEKQHTGEEKTISCELSAGAGSFSSVCMIPDHYVTL